MLFDIDIRHPLLVIRVQNLKKSLKQTHPSSTEPNTPPETRFDHKENLEMTSGGSAEDENGTKLSINCPLARHFRNDLRNTSANSR
jgi:hypothetical protein